MKTCIKSFPDLPLSEAQIGDLRSDHAGECGAVAIYNGILAVTRDPGVARFARAHRRTEVRHRRFFDRWLPQAQRSRLLPLWRLSGWLLGAVAASFGGRTVYRTIAAVESFVEQHYLDQIADMRATPELRPLAAILQSFCDDEVEHRDDAQARDDLSPGPMGRLWTLTIGAGSAAGVAVARRI
jgi:ubiquinone biosynthesis monooxygenase Coq7